MKDVRIDGKLQRVFVLKETDTRLVYIPVKSLQEVDYIRFIDMEKKGGSLLKVMAETKLDNGRNALVQYDNIIQVMQYTNKADKLGTRLRKPEEGVVSTPTPYKEESQTQTMQPQVMQRQEVPQPQSTPTPIQPPNGPDTERFPDATEEAPWGFKADGTPRLRPGPGSKNKN